MNTTSAASSASAAAPPSAISVAELSGASSGVSATLVSPSTPDDGSALAAAVRDRLARAAVR